MKKYKFKSMSICSEFNIAIIAEEYGIKKKIKWEDALVLKGDSINSIKNYEDKMVYIYHFGVMVFMNFEETEIVSFIKHIKTIPNGIKSYNADMKYDFYEDYVMIEDKTNEEEVFGFDDYIVDKVENYHFDMMSLVLAKSVALEPIESRISIVIDETEPIITSLKKGKLKANNKKLTSLIGSILSFRHTTISYIQLLDKPAVTWKNENAELLFNELADNFELTDRYNTINDKIGALLSITEIFSNLGNTKKAINLDLLVVILIFIELILLEPDILRFITNLFNHIFLK